MFDLFDQDRNGRVTQSEIITTFKELNLPITNEFANMLILEYDKNGDGQLEFTEFISFIREYMHVKNYPTEGMFNYFDLDGDGHITIEEFVKSMRCLGIDIPVSSAQRMFDEIDSSGTYKIDYENFNEMMKLFL